MALRIQLLNDFLGPLVIETDDPIDINSLTQTVKRSEVSDGIVFEIIFDLDFIKKGRRYIKQAYEQYGGIDAVVTVLLYEYDPNLRKWKLYGTGQVNYNKYDLSEETVTVNIEQTGVERRVLNMMEIDVDLETEVSENGSALPAQIVWDMPFHSKAILKQYEASPENDHEEVLGFGFFSLPGITPSFSTSKDILIQVQVNNSVVVSDDLEDTFKVPFSLMSEVVVTGDLISGAGDEAEYQALLAADLFKEPRSPIYEALDAGTLDVDIQLRIKHTINAFNTIRDIDVCGSGALGECEVWAWFEHRNKADEILSIESIGQWSMAGCGGDSRVGSFETKNYTDTGINIEIGDKIYVFLTYRIYGSYQNPGFPASPEGEIIHDALVDFDLTETYVKFSNKTLAPENTVTAPLIYEAVERCVQYYTNQPLDCFYSELLGRTDRGYAQNGKYSMISVPNGNRLRGRNDKKMFDNLANLLQFINSVACVGIGFETVDGKQRLRLEEKSFFYNKTYKIASLGKIYKPKKSLDPKRFYNQVRYGYSTKVDVAIVNGVDAFCTLRKSIIPIINTKNKYEIDTTRLADGFQIELQRRLFTSTEDGKHDDDNFAVVVITDGMGGFKSKKNEGYDLIENVFDPPTGYNYDISPARNLRNHLQVIASCLIRSFNKTLKFSSGEKNYSMRTKKTSESFIVEENGSIDLTNVEPIWDNEIYSIDSPMSREIMQLAKANPYGYFEFEDMFGEKFEGFINTDAGVEHNSTEKKATLRLLRVHRP